MPIYEYRCTTCGERFERLTARGERAKARCPHCRGSRVERMLSTFAVVKSSGPAAAPGPCGSADCACRTPEA